MTEADAGAYITSAGSNCEELRGEDGASPRPIVARLPSAPDDDNYNMNHRNRGYAVIFNHEHFESYSQRRGTDKDSIDLQQVLRDLGFQVEVFNDLKKRDLIAQLKNLSKRDHTDNDCLVVCALTHGKPDFLLAEDAFYPMSSLWKDFTADNCPSLAGKPKLFIVQACQGEQTDCGVGLRMNEYLRTDSASEPYCIPIQADFLMAYSGPPGYKTFRNPESGSWYIQELVKELSVHGREHDLTTILTTVARRVANNYESKTLDPSLNNMKQIPYYESRLMRKVYFNHKRAVN